MTGNKKKAAAGLDALKQLATPPVSNTMPQPSASESNDKPDKVVFSLHLPEVAHSKLRELSFYERNSMTKLILEGVDLLFSQRGLPSIEELKQDGMK
ncbi:hypothetical protein [Thiolinea disciformis]|uniref:hypothetical protein n=1 Tax=Thiolinea disciformis TaxID=125614 RepID=UPI00037B0169|nr:hypothetical protein [Thiolinea disciformis]